MEPGRQHSGLDGRPFGHEGGCRQRGQDQGGGPPRPTTAPLSHGGLTPWSRRGSPAPLLRTEQSRSPAWSRSWASLQDREREGLKPGRGRRCWNTSRGQAGPSGPSRGGRGPWPCQLPGDRSACDIHFPSSLPRPESSSPSLERTQARTVSDWPADLDCPATPSAPTPAPASPGPAPAGPPFISLQQTNRLTHGFLTLGLQGRSPRWVAGPRSLRRPRGRPCPCLVKLLGSPTLRGLGPHVTLTSVSMVHVSL